MSFMIKSEVSEQYLLEEDAVEGFRQAVNNGQIRLALQILVDIVDVFEGFIASVLEDVEEEETVVEQKVEPAPVEQKAESTKEVQQDKVEEVEQKEVVQEKKTTAKKSSAKDQESNNAAE